VRAITVVKRGSDSDSITLCIDYGIMRRIRRFTMRPGPGGRWRQKSVWTPESIAWRCPVELDTFPPRFRVALRNKFSNRDLVVIRISKVFSPIHVSAAPGFGDQVDPRGTAIAEMREIIALEDVERAD